MGEVVFALDIGTRTVVGLVAEATPEGLRVLGAEVAEHRNRAMLDGQIHDVGEVARVVAGIKDTLAGSLGLELTGAAVAAAGRALKTVRATAERQVSILEEIPPKMVLALELQGVQQAQRRLAADSKEQQAEYQCVGYSVVHYLLDGHPIGNPVGQKGRRISVEVLATFLPRVVVDSLFAVLDRADLEMQSLTLEPIAASQVVIPPGMRQLNLALVDIGAGTSDIALASRGSIIAYDMVPMAGDEVTEALCQHFILDFATGEKLKRRLGSRSKVEFTDVLGNKHKLTSAEVLPALDGVVAELAAKISEKILLLNEKAPQAVLCIGGGSLTPGLTAKLAEALGLSKERVAIRGREIIHGVSGSLKNLSGPEAVTPLGIAFTALRGLGLGFARVQVNGKSVRLFELRNGTVADALLAAGISLRQVLGRPGLALTVEVNGEVRMIRGSLGKEAKIAVNGQPAALDTPVGDGDMITLEAGEDGEDASALVRDVLPPMEALTLKVNGETLTLEPEVTMDGSPVTLDTPLTDGARLFCKRPEKIIFADIFSYISFDPTPPAPGSTLVMEVNGQPAEFTTELKPGDQVTVAWQAKGAMPCISEDLSR